MKSLCLLPKTPSVKHQALDVIEAHATSANLFLRYSEQYASGLIVEHFDYIGLHQLQKQKEFATAVIGLKYSNQ